STNKEFNCTVKVGNETVTFYLQDLYVNQTDIYFCKLEVLYPPPYIDNEKSNGTIIHVKGNMKTKRNRMLQSDYMNMTPRRPGPTRRHYQPYAPARDFAAYRS
ncbi:CD28, partial [Cervus elaphus hippelaphus]